MRSSWRRGLTLPPLSVDTDLLEGVRLDDGPSAYAACGQGGHDVGRRLTRVDVPAAVLVVSPRVRYLLALEAPLEPAHLDEGQVLGELERRPSGRQLTPPEGVLREPRELVDQGGSEEVEIGEEHLTARVEHGRGRGKRDTHGHHGDRTAGSSRPTQDGG